MHTHRPRLLGLALLAACGATAVPADDTEKVAIPPRVVKIDLPHSNLGKVAAAVGKQTGIPFTFPRAAADEPCEAPFAGGKPFWDALEMIAGQTGNRIVLHDNGRKIALEPRGKSYEVSSVHGPFRVVAREVVGRSLLDLGVTFHEVHLDAHWEPRFPVFRIDSQPKVTKATDDRGTALAAQPATARGQPTGAVHAATVRLTGLTREARRIALLRGHFRVTASEKMLTFRFPDLTAKPPVALPPQEKVAATLKRVEKDEKVWEFEIELGYPADIPKFESFESWTTENRLRLVSPEGAKTFAPDDYEIQTIGPKVVAVYRFKEDAAKGLVNPAAKGWTLAYEAPSPPVEFDVPFEIKDIPLP
ncbi:MAG: hypothetical protein JWO38_6032 [Gemmataceae bacterium]|nr:hypothetical protein [Gemmataceae bacterium]